MVNISKYTCEEIDDSISFVNNSPDVFKILALLSLVENKQGNLYVTDTYILSIAIIDNNDNLVAGIDYCGTYVGMTFSAAVTFINSIT